MNNTEPFDEWIRDEVNNLHDAPARFESGALWQKMQLELHTKPAKENTTFVMATCFFVMLTRTGLPVRASKIAACLLLLAGLWWQWPKSERLPLAQHPTKALEMANAKPTPPLRGTPSRRGLAHRQSLPLEDLAGAKKANGEVLKVLDVQQIDTKTEPIVTEEAVVQTLDYDNASIAEEMIMPAEPAPLPASKTKPKFKIVHANELADYQRTELAETRAKEAEKQGFVVINWQQKDQKSDNNLLTYLRNRNKKAE